MELLRPILELGVVIPGMLLAYFPVKSSLKQPLSKLVLWLVPLLALLCAAGGVVCYARRMPTAPMLAGLTLLAVVIYIKTLRISLWKSGTIALSVCAVFACINSLSRAINAAMLAGLPQAQAAPWFCLRSAICYHAICWLFAAIAYYPATHSVRRMVEDENFAQTWYVFWVLPLVFIALNLFMIPKYADTLYTGRVLQGYFVISIALLFLMLFFNAIFLLMAISINRNVRLQQENQLLSMQQQRYESLKAAIEEARQARHDLRHQLCQLAALAEEGNLEKIKAYLSGAVSRIPSLEMHFCQKPAADSVVGYYCALAKRENIPYSVQIDLPECLPVDEINLCLVLSNLLENALERILTLTNDAFDNNDMRMAAQVEPLEEVIDVMAERLRDQHILRLKDGVCSIDTGVVFLDVLNNAERISDHCSNVAARLIGMDAGEDYDSHTLKSIMHHNPTKDYMLEYEECRKAYLVPLEEMEA